MQLETLIEQHLQECTSPGIDFTTGVQVPPKKVALNEMEISILNLILAKRLGTEGQRNALLRVLEAAKKQVTPAHFPTKKLFRNLEITAGSNGLPLSIS